MHVFVNETGIAPSRSRIKQYAEEFRFKCSCGYRSAAHPIRAGVVRAAEWHELNAYATNVKHETTIQKR